MTMLKQQHSDQHRVHAPTDLDEEPRGHVISASEIHRWLMLGFNQSACAGFDAHVLASVLSLAVSETHQGVPLVSGLGLDAPTLEQLVGELFPHARSLVAGLDPTLRHRPEDDERQLRELLARGSTSRDTMEMRLAAILARRCQRPHHLWQELGLRNRGELGWLMERHFEPLAARNTRGMRWKKFLYRMICRDTGYTLCPAPSCSECSEHDVCFGSHDD